MSRENKDALEVTIVSAVWLVLIAISCKVGGSFGFTLLVLGTIITGMFAYYEWRAEKALARERAKVKMFAEKLNEAHADERENYFSQY